MTASTQPNTHWNFDDIPTLDFVPEQDKRNPLTFFGFVLQLWPRFDESKVWLRQYGLEWRQPKIAPGMYYQVDFPNKDLAMLFKLTFIGL